MGLPDIIIEFSKKAVTAIQKGCQKQGSYGAP